MENIENKKDNIDESVFLNKLKKARKIVIKIGTSTLTHTETGKLNYRFIDQLARVAADLKNAGYEIVLVSSGAIGVGVGKLNLKERPVSLPKRQALAAIGQSSLMAIYEKYFGEYGYTTAQVLLTKAVLEDKESYENIKNTFHMLFEYGVVPIVNENDVVSVNELIVLDHDDVASLKGAIKFGDNDNLSAYVAKFIKADLLIILSDINGLYDSDPKDNEDAKIIPLVTEITEEIYKLAGGTGSKNATGGMVTKLNAAETVMKAGIGMVIMNGARPKDIYKLLEGNWAGTVFFGYNNC